MSPPGDEGTVIRAEGLVKTYGRDVRAVAFSPDGATLATASGDLARRDGVTITRRELDNGGRFDGAFEMKVQFGFGQSRDASGQRFGSGARAGHVYCRGSAGLPALIQAERPDVVVAGQEPLAWYVPQIAREHGLPGVLSRRRAFGLGLAAMGLHRADQIYRACGPGGRPAARPAPRADCAEPARAQQRPAAG